VEAEVEVEVEVEVMCDVKKKRPVGAVGLLLYTSRSLAS